MDTDFDDRGQQADLVKTERANANGRQTEEDCSFASIGVHSRFIALDLLRQVLLGYLHLEKGSLH
jgi:hypothetical protein